MTGRLFDAAGGLSAARFGLPGTIDGFVLRLDPRPAGEAMRLLDDVEDEGREYRRVPVAVRTRDGGQSAAYAYEYLGAVGGAAHNSPQTSQ